MFKVQRFTAEDDDEEGGRVDDSTSILNKVLAKAKARASAKRARLPPSSDGAQRQADTSAPPLETTSGTNFALNSDAGGLEGGAAIPTGGPSLPAADSTKDRVGSPVQEEEEGGGTGEDGQDSSEEEVCSSGEGNENRGRSSGKEKDAEILRTAQPGTQSPPAAAGGGAQQQEADGQGLRPMEEVAEEWGLDSRLAETLREEGVKHFFPIQIRVVPDIVATERHSHVQSRDICVSAPTGSGKTLVFVLGVLQALIRRRVVRLRALVLLPSRDLAMQVHAVFKRYAQGTGLRVGLAIGQTNFLEEQLALVGAVALEGNPVATARASFLRAQGRGMGPDSTKGGLNLDLDGWSAGAPTGGSSEVDIVVATPGRLLDHLAQTPGFTLQHLRYLVIDEADRLLNQSYQGWVGKVIKAAYRRTPGRAGPVYQAKPNKASNDSSLPIADDSDDAEDHISSANGNSASTATKDNHSRKRPRISPFPSSLPAGVVLDPVTVRGRPLAAGDRVRGATVSTPPLRKLLFSATLTNNPQKLAGLDVVNPLIYTAREMTRPVGSGGAGRGGEGDDSKRPSQETRRSNLDEISLAAGGEDGVEGRFSTPATLEETYTVCDSQAKPLVLLSLLREMIGERTELCVVFTSSVDSTHRLFRLLQLFGGFEGMVASADAKRGGEESVYATDLDDADGGVAEFSSSLGQRQRSRIIRRARAGAVRVIVCSDGMARGMDLDGVGLVVNYDVPSQAKTYVHRVGRTARAGSRGMAVTITKKGQVKQFLKMRSSVDGKRVRLDASPADQSRILRLAGRYQRCLKDLKEVLEAERTGELEPSASVTATEGY